MSDKLQKREETSPETFDDKSWVAPRVDVYENEEEVLLVADLPGAAREDVQINLDQDELTIEAPVAASPDGAALRAEFEPADFRRSFQVPPGIDGDKINADFKGGVLWLHMPKSAALKPRTLEVPAG